MLASVPMKMLAPTLTYPAAGVIATNPTTAPMQAPKAEGLRPRIASNRIHASMAAAEAVLVARKAEVASSEAASADPALKPNHPNHNIPVPRMTKGTLAGACGSRE